MGQGRGSQPGRRQATVTRGRGGGGGRSSVAWGRRPRRQHGRNPTASQAARLTPWGEDSCRPKMGLGCSPVLGRGCSVLGFRCSQTRSSQPVTIGPGTSSIGLSELNTRQKCPCVLTCQRLKRHKIVGPGASLLFTSAPAIRCSLEGKGEGQGQGSQG